MGQRESIDWFGLPVQLKVDHSQEKLVCQYLSRGNFAAGSIFNVIIQALLPFEGAQDKMRIIEDSGIIDFLSKVTKLYAQFT